MTILKDEEERGLCHDHFDEHDALVCCKELYGRRSGVIGFSHGHDCGLDNFWIDDLVCTGEEHSITECRHAPFGEHNCNPLTGCV